MYDKRSKSTEVEGSKYFHLSEGASKDMYTKMHRDGMSQDNLKKFVQMEDAFLALEQKSVRSGIPYTGDASILSNRIKQTFPKYDFSYHTIHLKQIAEPNKTLNRNIKNMYS
jgi:hypothetical protein